MSRSTSPYGRDRESSYSHVANDAPFSRTARTPRASSASQTSAATASRLSCMAATRRTSMASVSLVGRRHGRLSPVLETFTHATFEPHVGDSFLLRGPQESPVELVLVDASLLPALARPETRAPFSIVFRGPSGAILPQAIYRLDHGTIGTFDLF